MQKVTNAIRKTVRSLAEARHRSETGLFVAEGAKCALDILPAFLPEMFIATPEWLADNPLPCPEDIVFEATRADMERMTTLQSPPKVIAVCHIPEEKPQSADALVSAIKGSLVIALDRIQDPGNLGTIIRVADWMGVSQIIASPDTVGVFNHKVVQATMGSLARVKVIYRDLAPFLEHARHADIAVYGTFLDGEDIYTTPLTSDGIIVMGNEGRGVSAPVTATVSHRLFIPPYPADATTAESLNVAVATAITLSEFRRRIHR